jgi:glutamyl-tRNA synthetase
MGYLPEALRNYLSRLGWSHGDDEIMSTEQMIEWFDVTDVNKGAARFDFAKLEATNGLYIRGADDAYLVERIVALLPELENTEAIREKLSAPEMRAKLLAAMPGLKERAKTLTELIDSAGYLFAERPLNFDEKASGILSDEARQVLGRLRPQLEAVGEWSVEALDAAVRAFAETEELKLGKVAQPLRAALTGRATSPGVFDVLAVLGREESLARIRDCES